MRWEYLAFTAAAFAFLALQHWRQRSAVRAARGAIYDDCTGLIESPRIEQHGTQFPSLQGSYEGKRIRLDALIDSAGMRKLPSVWLQVNVLEALPIESTLDLLVRPQNTEFFSPSAQLPLRLEIPAGWPEHAILKSDRNTAAELPPRIDAQVRELFADVRCKELLVTPKGVRIVYQLAQAERADYLVLRAMVFDGVRVSPELLTQLARSALALHAALSGAVKSEEAAAK
jgi:hypothetical protein